MSDNGWIKLHRKVLSSPLWKDCNANQKVIMITLLLMANHQPNRWIFDREEYEVVPGQFISSLQSISEESGCSISTVRRSLEKFEKYGFSTSKSTNKNRLITIENWEKYQSYDEEPTSKPTSNRQATDKQPTTNKNDKNDKNEKNEKIYIVEQSPTSHVYENIIGYLNDKAGTSYKPSSSATKRLITSRLNKGFTDKDFYQVIDTKVSDWLKDSNMKKYLRPQTLFGTKFESYLNQPSKSKAYTDIEKDIEITKKGWNF